MLLSQFLTPNHIMFFDFFDQAWVGASPRICQWSHWNSVAALTPWTGSDISPRCRWFCRTNRMLGGMPWMPREDGDVRPKWRFWENYDQLLDSLGAMCQRRPNRGIQLAHLTTSVSFGEGSVWRIQVPGFRGQMRTSRADILSEWGVFSQASSTRWPSEDHDGISSPTFLRHSCLSSLNSFVVPWPWPPGHLCAFPLGQHLDPAVLPPQRLRPGLRRDGPAQRLGGRAAHAAAVHLAEAQEDLPAISADHRHQHDPNLPQPLWMEDLDLEPPAPAGLDSTGEWIRSTQVGSLHHQLGGSVVVSQCPAALLAIPATGSQTLSENVHETGPVLTVVLVALDRGHALHLDECVLWITLDHFEWCLLLVHCWRRSLFEPLNLLSDSHSSFGDSPHQQNHKPHDKPSPGGGRLKLAWQAISLWLLQDGGLTRRSLGLRPCLPQWCRIGSRFPPDDLHGRSHRGSTGRGDRTADAKEWQGSDAALHLQVWDDDSLSLLPAPVLDSGEVRFPRAGSVPQWRPAAHDVFLVALLQPWNGSAGIVFGLGRGQSAGPDLLLPVHHPGQRLVVDVAALAGELLGLPPSLFGAAGHHCLCHGVARVCLRGLDAARSLETTGPAGA